MGTYLMPTFIRDHFYIPIFTDIPILFPWFLNIRLILFLIINRMITLHTPITMITGNLMIINIMRFTTISILMNMDMNTIMNTIRFMLTMVVIRIIPTSLFRITDMGMCTSGR